MSRSCFASSSRFLLTPSSRFALNESVASANRLGKGDADCALGLAVKEADLRKLEVGSWVREVRGEGERSCLGLPTVKD